MDKQESARELFTRRCDSIKNHLRDYTIEDLEIRAKNGTLQELRAIGRTTEREIIGALKRHGFLE